MINTGNSAARVGDVYITNSINSDNVAKAKAFYENSTVYINDKFQNPPNANNATESDVVKNVIANFDKLYPKIFVI